MLDDIYNALLSEYGQQGWWPISGEYHPGIYSVPKHARFEVAAGAILTQNTAWLNVEKALSGLRANNALREETLLALGEQELVDAIRPAGYYNQKARKLRILAKHLKHHEQPTREGLLGLWGIGPETADSILLYAYDQPAFVIDTYTKRILAHHEIISHDVNYHDVQELFTNALPQDHALYNEYHALLVKHAKTHFSDKPYSDELLAEFINQ